MDPVFTIQWPEFVVIERLKLAFPKSEGYSVLIPASRQEKGFDLAVLKKGEGATRVATIQVKASRSYPSQKPKRETTKRYRFGTWFNRFNVPREADFFILLGMYAPDLGRTAPVTKLWYQSIMLLFTNDEMKAFIDSCRTVSGEPDRSFSFDFDDETRILLTRGDQQRSGRDYSGNLIEHRLDDIKLLLES